MYDQENKMQKEIALWIKSKRISADMTLRLAEAQFGRTHHVEVQKFEAALEPIPAKIFIKLMRFYRVDDLEVTQFVLGLQTKYTRN